MDTGYGYRLQTCACFGVYASSVQLCNTSRYVLLFVIMHMRVLSPHACGTTRLRHAPRHAQSVMGPESSNYHEGSEPCNIANGQPINSAQRVLNNTAEEERNTICRHAHVSVFTPRQCSFVTHLQSLSKVLGQMPQIHISYPEVIPPRPLFNVG